MQRQLLEDLLKASNPGTPLIPDSRPLNLLFSSVNASFFKAEPAYVAGIIGPQNEDGEAFRRLRAEAQAGNVNSAYSTAMLYLEGTVVNRHTTNALIFLKQAAAGNHIKAQCTLGEIYLNPTKWNLSIELQNQELAIHYLELAAEQKCVDVYYVLASYFYENNDPINALKYCLKAPLHDQCHSLIPKLHQEISSLYIDFNSPDVDDIATGLKCLKQTAAENNECKKDLSNVLHKLSEIFLVGDGVSKDLIKAEFYWKEAIAFGYSDTNSDNLGFFSANRSLKRKNKEVSGTSKRQKTQEMDQLGRAQPK